MTNKKGIISIDSVKVVTIPAYVSIPWHWGIKTFLDPDLPIEYNGIKKNRWIKFCNLKIIYLREHRQYHYKKEF